MIASDNLSMRQSPCTLDAMQAGAIPWALQMRAISGDEPGRLVQTLTGAILGCGGWVLSRGATDTGLVNMLVEFERHSCIDIYTVLIASGIELSKKGHVRFTELCQCTRMGTQNAMRRLRALTLRSKHFP